MLNKILFLTLSLLLISCGKDVKMKPNKLESVQALKKYEKAGILNTATNSIFHNGKSYKISKYSSHQSLTFINSQPGASEIPIVCRCGFDSLEVVLESIQRQ